MIKVISGKMWDGKNMYVHGDIITTLSEDEEDYLVEAGKAEYHYEKEEQLKTPPSKLIPDGNVEGLKKYISTIEDAELLNEMIDEEMANLQRKTLIEAIEKRIEALKKVEDDGNGKDPESDDENNTDTKSDNSLKIDFNMDDVMKNG
jgi:hypothetical protein